MSREEKARKIRVSIIKLSKEKSALSVNELRIILALERIVARLSTEPILDSHLIYKGGFVLMKSLDSHRFTRDLDALGLGLDKKEVSRLVPMALVKDLNDGFWFGDIRTESLDGQGEYGGLRFSMAYQIGDPPEKTEAMKKLSRVHFDIGFGDTIPSELAKTTMINLLPLSSDITWRIYPPEFIFSEKLETLISRGSTNSRSKDVYDLNILFDKCSENKKIYHAITETFNRRQTTIPDSFYNFSQKLDLTFLQNSWKSVQLKEENIQFIEIWNELLIKLKKLDLIFRV